MGPGGENTVTEMVNVVFLDSHVIITYEDDSENHYIIAKIIDSTVEKKEDNL